jgi:hypothetical protein
MTPISFYVARETAVAFVANAVVNSTVVWLVFGGRNGIPLLGISGLALDFAPQLIIIGFIGSIVPALITRHRLAGGSLDLPRSSSLPTRARLFRRSLIVGIALALMLGPIATALLLLADPGPYSFDHAFIIKTIVGCSVPLFVTGWSIRALLSRPREPVAGLNGVSR